MIDKSVMVKVMEKYTPGNNGKAEWENVASFLRKIDYSKVKDNAMRSKLVTLYEDLNQTFFHCKYDVCPPLDSLDMVPIDIIEMEKALAHQDLHLLEAMDLNKGYVRKCRMVRTPLVDNKLFQDWKYVKKFLAHFWWCFDRVKDDDEEVEDFFGFGMETTLRRHIGWRHPLVFTTRSSPTQMAQAEMSSAGLQIVEHDVEAYTKAKPIMISDNENVLKEQIERVPGKLKEKAVMKQKYVPKVSQATAAKEVPEKTTIDVQIECRLSTEEQNGVAVTVDSEHTGSEQNITVVFVVTAEVGTENESNAAVEVLETMLALSQVADFGLTKLTEVGNASLQTRLVGTFGYMPPDFATRFAQEESNDMMITCVIFTPQLIEAIGFLKTYNFYARRGYYSYIYAKCLAATIWADVCAKDPISLAIGTTLRAKLLQHGGAKEASTLLKDLVGSDDILRYHGKGSVPNLTSLC
ncbi:hypothetical protein GIB67_007555 [Kingdonia uniflora]|uniref:Peptidase M3A/M3B catalytic domain-containing protein n=1 Tax=Kingdonia uniflora TaxID=39325 RepID=A0A7J7LNL9_9MAGN|nr:hypothetical protein GIB67_007555 [Kingdonia uniflora]